jgi:hypothetical protein
MTESRDSRREAYWIPLKKQKSRPRKGKLVVAGGRVVADGVTLEEARGRFGSAYRVVSDRGSSDALDRRLPGSYGSKQ